MGKLAKKIKPLRKLDAVYQGTRAIGGQEKADQITGDYLAPVLTQAEQAEDMAQEAKSAAEAEKAKKPVPMADEAALRRARRRGEQSRRNRGRASTILGSDSETLG